MNEGNKKVGPAMAALDAIQTLINQTRDDAAKSDGGTRAATTRVRKALMEIKRVAHESRQRVLS